MLWVVDGKDCKDHVDHVHRNQAFWGLVAYLIFVTSTTSGAGVKIFRLVSKNSSNNGYFTTATTMVVVVVVAPPHSTNHHHHHHCLQNHHHCSTIPDTTKTLSQMDMFCCEISYVVIYAVLSQNQLWRDSRVFGVKFLSWKWCWCQKKWGMVGRRNTWPAVRVKWVENCPNVTLSLRHQSAVVLTHFLIAGTRRSDVPVLWIKLSLSGDEIDLFSRCAVCKDDVWCMEKQEALWGNMMAAVEMSIWRQMSDDDHTSSCVLW